MPSELQQKRREKSPSKPHSPHDAQETAVDSINFADTSFFLVYLLDNYYKKLRLNNNVVER